MANRPSEWHLLFGLLGLQNGLVTREQLVQAFGDWVGDKSTAVDQVLVSCGAVNKKQAEALCQLVDLHIEQHGDIEQSLAAISGTDLPMTIDHLRDLSDPELNQTICLVGTNPKHLDSTLTSSSVGQSTTDGRFRILRPLEGGRGGMGVINVAHDEELGRSVALKQIRSDRAHVEQYRTKFQLEAEVTGNLEHPGIVPIYGLGSDTNGHPYYAMRLVRGDNLKSAIRQFHTKQADGTVDFDSVEFYELIDRLIDVSQAISYAHGRGVLHRDLKPGNILVGKYGETLVIDWGLARVLAEEPTEATTDSIGPVNVRSGSSIQETEAGAVMGSLGYAPPEQLAGEVSSIGLHSDVYSLGAILYEMLTNTTPVETKRDGKSRTAQEIITDTQKGKIKQPAEHVPSAPRALSAVAMKALSVNQVNRYDSAMGFIDELKRWKADLPVLAHSESMGEKILRFARRHRAASISLVATIFGIAVASSIAALLVNQQRQAAEIARQDEANAKSEAENLAGRNERVINAFVDAFRSTDPRKGADYTMSAKDVLVQAMQHISVELNADPIAKTNLLESIGMSFRGLGESRLELGVQRDVLRLRREFLGETHPETMHSMTDVALSLSDAGQHHEAFSLYEETLELRRQHLGPNHPDTLTSMNNLAIGYDNLGKKEIALDLYEKTFEMRRSELGAEHSDTIFSMANLARELVVNKDFERGIALSEKAYQLKVQRDGSDHPDALYWLCNIGIAYRDSDQHDKAIPMLEKSLLKQKAKLGLDHPFVLRNMEHLSIAYSKTDDWDRAIALQEELVELRNFKQGVRSEQALKSSSRLVDFYRQSGKHKKTLPLPSATETIGSKP